jgi:hypothetical protein
MVGGEEEKNMEERKRMDAGEVGGLVGDEEWNGRENLRSGSRCLTKVLAGKKCSHNCFMVR